MSTPTRIALGAVSLLLVSIPARAVSAQAWVGERNSLSATLDYTYASSDKVYESWEHRDDLVDIDPIVNHNIVLGAEYTPIDRLGVQLAIPIVTTHYDYDPGQTSLPPHGRYDDGSYHSALQDLRLDVRYMVLDNTIVAVAPHVAVSVPMTDYETVGYASAGRGLKQLIFGLSVGKYFTSGVPDLYLHGRYEFRWTEGYETPFPQTEEYGQNKSFIQALVGYFILDRLEVNLAADLQLAHGGFEFEDWDMEGPPAQFYHDALLAEQFFLLGGGASYQVLDRLRVSAFARLWLWGEQTRNANAFGLGLGWDFM